MLLCPGLPLGIVDAHSPTRNTREYELKSSKLGMVFFQGINSKIYYFSSVKNCNSNKAKMR